MRSGQAGIGSLPSSSPPFHSCSDYFLPFSNMSVSLLSLSHFFLVPTMKPSLKSSLRVCGSVPSAIWGQISSCKVISVIFWAQENSRNYTSWYQPEGILWREEPWPIPRFASDGISTMTLGVFLHHSCNAVEWTTIRTGSTSRRGRTRTVSLRSAVVWRNVTSSVILSSGTKMWVMLNCWSFGL